MSERLRLAKQLIQQDKFESAKKILAHNTNDLETVRISSLLHRYDGEYDVEQTLVERALEIDSGDTYMRERSAWHTLPWLDRLVLRKPLKSMQPRQAPPPSILEKSAIVSGADSNYFHFLIQLIESIQNSNYYKEIPICILDCGLTDAQKHSLQTQYKVHDIQTATWPVNPKAKTMNMGGVKTVEMHSGYKGIMNKPFLFQYFPNFEYIFWIDADSWVQDDRVFDTGFLLTEKYGIGVPFKTDHVATSIIGMKKNSPILSSWQKDYRRTLEQHFFYYASEDRSLEAAIGNSTIEFIDMGDLYHYCPRCKPYLPFVLENDDTLYDPVTEYPLAIFTLNAHTDKNIVCCPLPVKQTADETIENYESGSGQLIEEIRKNVFISPTQKFFRKQKLTSLHYRVLPEFDKSFFTNIIMSLD